VELPKECVGATVQTIGGTSSELVKQSVEDGKIPLLPFAVSVVTLKDDAPTKVQTTERN
jgi:hypothetical protein